MAAVTNLQSARPFESIRAPISGAQETNSVNSYLVFPEGNGTSSDVDRLFKGTNASENKKSPSAIQSALEGLSDAVLDGMRFVTATAVAAYQAIKSKRKDKDFRVAKKVEEKGADGSLLYFGAAAAGAAASEWNVWGGLKWMMSKAARAARFLARSARLVAGVVAGTAASIKNAVAGKTDTHTTPAKATGEKPGVAAKSPTAEPKPGEIKPQVAEVAPKPVEVKPPITTDAHPRPHGAVIKAEAPHAAPFRGAIRGTASLGVATGALAFLTELSAVQWRLKAHL
jgi:hypothetical protein